MRNTKYDALLFTKALLQESKTFIKKPPFEPPVKNGIAYDEGSAQSAILDYLLLEMVLGHLFVQRINNQPVYDSKQGKYRAMSKGSHRGFPDIFVMKDSRCIFLEIKSSSGMQSKDQIEVQGLLEAQDAEYYIVRSLDGVQKALRPISSNISN